MIIGGGAAVHLGLNATGPSRTEATYWDLRRRASGLIGEGLAVGFKGRVSALLTLPIFFSTQSGGAMFWAGISAQDCCLPAHASRSKRAPTGSMKTVPDALSTPAVNTPHFAAASTRPGPRSQNS
jgi:hypothetical protein